LQIFNSKAEEVLSSSNIWSFIPSIVHPFLKFHHQHLPLSLPSPKDHQEHQQKIGSSIVLKLLSQHTPQILTMPLTCIKQTFTLTKIKKKKNNQLSTPLLPFTFGCMVHFSSIRYSFWQRSHPTPFHPTPIL
jgi:hypothetical protein